MLKWCSHPPSLHLTSCRGYTHHTVCLHQLLTDNSGLGCVYVNFLFCNKTTCELMRNLAHLLLEFINMWILGFLDKSYWIVLPKETHKFKMAVSHVNRKKDVGIFDRQKLTFSRKIIIMLMFVMSSFIDKISSTPTAPLPPVHLASFEVSPTSVRLRWESPNENSGESYIVQYKVKNDSLSFNEVRDIKETHFTVRQLRVFTPYIFRVKAVNELGVSKPSMEILARTDEIGLYVSQSLDVVVSWIHRIFASVHCRFTSRFSYYSQPSIYS